LQTFSEFIIRHRSMVLSAVFAITCFLGYGFSKVTINSDILSYLDPADPAIALFNRVGDDYGGNTLAMVAVESENIFSAESLELINSLTEKYKQIPGVMAVMSLTNIMDIKKTDVGLEISKLIDNKNIPSAPEALEALRDYTLNKDMYAGSIVSHDGKVTVIVCRLSSEMDKADIAAQIKQLAEDNKGEMKMYYSGLPLQLIEVNGMLASDLVNLIPIVVLVVIMVLYISFRSRRGVIFPLATVIISTLWTVGLMGWLGVQFSIISNIMPVLLIAIGTAYGIHFLAKYSEDMAEGDDKITGIQRALGEVGVPIVLTGVTTLIGFLSFIGSSLTAVTDFGVFSAIGVGFAMILTITFVPCALTFMEPPKKRPQRNGESAMNRIMDRLGTLVLSNEKLILWGVVLIIIVSIVGIPRLETAVNMAEYFPEDSEIRIADKLMEDQFGGSLPIQVLFNGELKDPAVLKEMHQFQKYLESLPDVSNSQSLANLVCEMNDVLNGYYAIPESREQVANLLFLLEGDDVLDQLVNKNYTEGLIQARFRSMDTQKILETVDSIQQYLSHEVDTILASIHLSESGDTELLEAREHLIKQSVEAIAHDATKRQPGADLDRETIQATIAAFLNKSHGQLTDQERADLMNELILYFEEESDVEIDSDELIQGTASRILGIVDEDTPSRVDITALLKSVVPKLYWSDDPEVIDYTAEGIEDIVRNAQRYHDVNKLSTSIMAVLPKTLQDDEKFYRDLRGDLFPTTGNIVWIPTNDASPSSTSRLQARQAGMLRVLNQVNTSLLNSQMQSLLIALVLVLLLMMIQFKSINMGLVVTSPIMLTVLINFAVMAYADIPLDNATMMIASIAIGIGIDYAIHFSTRFKMELRRQGSELLALEKTLETTGRAIIINALTVAMGFIILIWSSIVPIQRFGALIALTMAVSAWATLTLLPALILVFKKRLPINNAASNSAIQ